MPLNFTHTKDLKGKFWVMYGKKNEMLVVQSCPTLCNPIDYTVPGILQARILEWGAIPFSRGISPTQGSNPGFPPCRQILYCLSPQGSPGSCIFYYNFFQFFLSFIFGWAGLFAPVHGLALTAASGGSPLAALLSASLGWLFLSQNTGSRAPGLRVALSVAEAARREWRCADAGRQTGTVSREGQQILFSNFSPTARS